ncbi:hypothetical protein GmHk_06G016586 [Glycine max]|nr:hypothetical protein GmHk_06G016586 [Glycine max]
MGNEDLAMLENLSLDATQKTQKDHDGIVIPISDEKPWKNRLLVKVLGAWVNFRIIEAKLQRSWTKNDTIQIIDVQDGYYQVIFTSADDYKFALYEGPWMETKKVAVWIRIPRLPIELYNDTLRVWHVTWKFFED